MNRHFPQFEVLRGAASFWVYASHVLLICGLSIPILSAGGSAVDVFVILSGFVIALLRIRSSEPYTGYIFRRFIRLYPLFLVALVLGFLTSQFYVSVIGHNPWATNGYTQTFLTRSNNEADFLWLHLLAHLTMLHGAIPDTTLPQAAFIFSGPLWSISLEWQFYLIAPLLVWCLDWRARQRWPFIFATLGLIAVLHMVVSRYWPDSGVPAFLPQRLELFALGIICAVGLGVAQQVKSAYLGIAICIFLGLYHHFGRTPIFPVALWFFVYTAAVIGERVKAAHVLNQLLSLDVARWVGARSYGLYVLHMPIVLTISHYVILPNAQTLGRLGSLLALIGLSLPTAFGLAALCYKYVELPSIAWAKRHADNYRTRNGGVAATVA